MMNEHSDASIDTDLFRKLLLAQFVECEELSGKGDVVNESTAGQFHPDDDVSVRHHHGYSTELDFQVFWQFLSPCSNSTGRKGQLR